MIHKIDKFRRPITPLSAFEKALEQAGLSDSEKELIDYIRYVGLFTQVSLTRALRLQAKPPALSLLCIACRKIGNHLPNHFEAVREWSRDVSEDGVRWDGDLLCSIAFNIDGERISPESGTAQYHTFVVHKELFTGLD